jgi:hypothetical protein
MRLLSGRGADVRGFEDETQGMQFEDFASERAPPHHEDGPRAWGSPP